jgi:hypothetical protein
MNNHKHGVVSFISVEEERFYKKRGKKAIVLRSHCKWPDGTETSDHHVLDREGMKELRNFLTEILEK